MTFGIALQFIVLQEDPGKEREIGDPIKPLRAHSSAVCQSRCGIHCADDPCDSMSWHDR